MKKQIAISVENLSKLYRLGEVGTGTLSHDLNRWWARVRRKDDPYSVVGEENDRTSKTNSRNGYVWALKDIEFQVEQGEVLGIIGRNGAGKSTLLKLLSRITAPTSGVIKARGRIASLLEVGTGMQPEMTGKENVYLNGTIMGMTKKEVTRKFDDIMDFAGCAKYADTPVKRYSSGMQVRLGFAVAAFLEPEILIVDEVLAVGDAEFQKRAVGKMQEVSRSEGRTVLFVSHNMASVSDLCHSSILLDKGRIIEKGATPEIIEAYLKSGDENCTGKYVNNHVSESNLYLKEAVVKNSSEEETGYLLYYEPLSIETIWEVKNRLPSPYINCWIRVYNSEGIFITAINTQDKSISFPEKGCYNIRASIPNYLAPGTYFLDIGIQQLHGKALDVHEKCMSFEVDTAPHKAENKFTVKTGRAVIGLSPEWEWGKG